jgi:fibrillarin-like pre-rRNA processing protein
VTFEELFPGIFKLKINSMEFLATKNLTPSLTVYGEKLYKIGDDEFRSWIPYRSKLAAAIMKGILEVPLNPGDKILYLGVASGTTCSHISDIVGIEGHIWGVDFAPRPMRDLIENVTKYRQNISPIMGDARKPRSYATFVPKVDAIYADIAQPDQAMIVVKNSKYFLKRCGFILLVVKSRSIDVTLQPDNVYSKEIEVLKRNNFEIIETLKLDPYEKAHAMVVAKYKIKD